MIDLRTYTAIECPVLLKWEVPNFDTAYVSDYNVPITYAGNSYTNIGTLLSISNTTSELTSTPGEITIALSGIPVNNISTLLSQTIKGSTISIYRAFYNPADHSVINVAGSSNVVQKFKGIVTNYSITDTVDVSSELAVSTITLNCNSIVEVLSKTTNGRRTNPADFVGENSMDRVQALANSNFNFGAP
jgi:hypothetical protein